MMATKTAHRFTLKCIGQDGWYDSKQACTKWLAEQVDTDGDAYLGDLVDAIQLFDDGGRVVVRRGTVIRWARVRRGETWKDHRIHVRLVIED